MNIRESVRIAELGMKAKVPFLLVGHSGVGKTAIVGELSNKVFPSHKFITVMASQCDVGDFVGIPDSIIDAQGNRVTSWARPEWMPYEPCVLFLDELNNARQDVESALLQLVYEGRINTHHLHPDSFICAAINPATSEYTTANVISSALVKRFIVIPFQPLASETITWAEDTKRYHPSVIRFLKHRPESTGVEKPLDTTIKMEPCPRLWEMTSKLIHQAELDNTNVIQDTGLIKTLLATSVGIETAAIFISFLETQEKPISFDSIIDNPTSAMERFNGMYKEMRGDLVAGTSDNVLKGVAGIINNRAASFSFINPAIQVDSDDKDIAKRAIKALNDNVTNNFGDARKSVDSVMTFLQGLPADIFFKLSYDIITRNPEVENVTQEQQIKILDSHFTIIMYMYSNNSLIKNHKTLFDKWIETSGQVEKHKKLQAASK